MKKILLSSAALAAVALFAVSTVSASDIATLTQNDARVKAAYGTADYEKVYTQVYQELNNAVANAAIGENNVDVFQDGVNHTYEYDRGAGVYVDTTAIAQRVNEYLDAHLADIEAEAKASGKSVDEVRNAYAKKFQESWYAAKVAEGGDELPEVEEAGENKEAKKDSAKPAAKEGKKVLPNTAAVK